MKRIWQQCTLLVIAILLVCSLVACEYQASAVVYPEVNRQILDLPAEFEVGPINVHRSGASVGELVIVTTTVKNIGDKEGNYTAILTMGGNGISKKKVPIKPKCSEEISFSIIPGTAGVKNLTVGNSHATLAAYRWPYTIIYDSDTRLGGHGYEHGPQSYGGSPGMAPPIAVRGNYGHMVRFSPPAVPFRVQMILINGEASVTSKTDWDNNYIHLRIWDSARTLLWSTDLPWRLFRYPREWNHIDVPNILVNGDFYVEVVTNSGRKDMETISIDYYVDHPGKGIYLYWDRPQTYLAAPAEVIETRSSASYIGVSVEIPDKFQGINWDIRVTGDGSLPR